MSARLTITGDERVEAKFERLARRVDNIRDAWPEVGNYLRKTMRQQFATSGARLGTPWQPLKAETRLWKLRSGYSRKILVRTGELRNSFTGNPMDIEEHFAKHAIFGSDNQKAIWHHYGTFRNGKRVNPPRTLLKVTPDVRHEVQRIVKKHILGKL